MDDRQLTMIVMAAAAAGALALLLLPQSPLAAKSRAVEGQQGTTWGPRGPAAPHVARGGLFHPDVCGEGRTGLIAHGWDWIADPPSERTGPGVADE